MKQYLSNFTTDLIIPDERIKLLDFAASYPENSIDLYIDR